MTELEAINTLLSVIGEAPVDALPSLTQNDITDAALARKTLTEVKRDVLAEGWSWNTDLNYPSKANTNKEFPLPSDTLRVTFLPSNQPHMNYVQRGLKIYDKAKRKFDFGDDVKEVIVDQLVRNIDWDECPHAGQQYITIRAARIYSDRFINSNVIYQYTLTDEDYARNQLIRAEEAGQQNNLLWGNTAGMGQGIGYLPVQGLRYRGG